MNVIKFLILYIPQLPKEIKLWVYPRNLPYLEITYQEKKWEKQLSKSSFENYRFTRGYLRYSLSQIYKINPLEIPLDAEPGKAPFLYSLNGHISISHTEKILFLAWAPNNIGIDIENKNRIFNANSLVSRFFKDDEKKELRKNNFSSISKEVLRYWIMKESAFKWQSIKKSSDFFQWEWIKKLGFAVNKKRGLKVKTYFHCYQDYYCGIAYN